MGLSFSFGFKLLDMLSNCLCRGAARLNLLVVQAVLQDVYHTQPGITCLILKPAADIVEAHISYAHAGLPASILPPGMLILMQRSRLRAPIEHHTEVSMLKPLEGHGHH